MTYAFQLVGSWLLYRLTSALWQRLAPGRPRWFPLKFVQMYLWIFLPYLVSAYLETWWQTHLGDHAGNAEFVRYDWGYFELGVFFWAWLPLFMTILGLFVVWAFRRARQAAGDQPPGSPST